MLSATRSLMSMNSPARIRWTRLWVIGSDTWDRMKPKPKELGAMAAVGEIHGPRGANGWSGACDTVGKGFSKTSEVNNTPEGSETSEVDNTVEYRLNPGVHPKL